jgi:predicted Zn finger-like uncharacterized protein
MIVTCDNCQTRYNLSLSDIGESGRRVRCTNCGHEWVQFQKAGEKREDDESDFIEIVMPDEDVVIEAETLDDHDPIPDAVKPNHEHDDIKKMISPPVQMPGLTPAVRGYAAAACLFVLIIAGLCIARNSVVVSWPPATGFFNMLGLETRGRGDGLMFEEVKAVSAPNGKGVAMLTISGKIGNMRNYPVVIPAIRTELRREDGSVADSWQIAPPSATIDGNAELPFSMNYPEVPDDVKDVKLTFALNGKATNVKKPEEAGDEEGAHR